MAVFNLVGTLVDDASSLLQGLADIDLINVNGSYFLAGASEADSAISIYSFTSAGAYTAIDSISYSNSSGTRTVSDLTFATVGGQMMLLPATRYEDQTAVYNLYSDGTLSTPKNATAGSLASEGIGLSHSVTIGTKTFVFTQDYGGQSLSSYQILADRSLIAVQTLTDTNATYLGDISALTSARVGTQDFLFVASAFDAGIAAYSVANSGVLTLSDTVAPSDGTGFARLADLVTVEVGGNDFLVAASAGTGGLLAYQVSASGTLSETGQLLDTLDTRFQGASQLEAFSYQNRAFVVAAGSDDGVTLLELLSDGSFVVHGSVADTYDTTLNNVSGLAVEIIAGVPELFVSSGTDNGFTQFTLTIGAPPDPPPVIPPVTGKQEDQQIDGTSGADTLTGGSSNDVLRGFEQKDTLTDGAGRDSLRGGGGADTFVFVQDGEVDVIEDFNPQLDVIDLTQFTSLNQLADINIISLPDQVVIEVGNEIIILVNDSQNWTVTDLTASQFIF